MIILNVGGTHFTTSITTLTRCSSYFEAMFSENWTKLRTNDDGENEQEENKFTPIFIDKDPEPFKFLLSYMREGFGNIPEDDLILAKKIILQANFFGLGDLIVHVKARAWRNIAQNSALTLCNGYSDQEAAEEFDRIHGGLMEALESDYLPALYFDKCDDHVELTVGERCFNVNKKTLQRHSDFFKRIIPSWSPLKRTYFLDEDPDAFQVLLRYIRYSQIEMPEDNPFLFRRIISVALNIEMRDFLLFVKAQTMVHVERRAAPMGLDPLVVYDFPFGGTTQITEAHTQYAADFDRRFKCFDTAFQSKVLPDRFFR